MKIIVAIKQVPDRDAPVRIAAGGKWIEEADLQWAMNEPDAYALEEALQLKEKNGGEVVVAERRAGARRPTIREALAKGADRAIQVGLRRSRHTRCAGRGAACWPPPSNPKTPTSCSPACSRKTSGWARPA